MEKKSDNPLARSERRKINYPLILAAVVLFGVLAVGVVLSVRSQDWIAAVMFLAAAGVFVILVLLDTANSRRLAAVDDRKFIRWDAAMPEIQRQNVNVEVRELVRILKMGEDQLPDLLSAYIVAED